ncbi:PREDICTED: uncharacterized protein LOC107328774 isoform X3 [Acropora digitifera]|uniref:uncharacterized protein LOC107328774 isoform X3 n=1 Tax=Acropora digitifera TaxID=70779 RepID=UPI00077B02E3|nr:PREDICTED: uncharacterized protein LOC107328774 isoform X3 [Acropora digitifera]
MAGSEVLFTSKGDGLQPYSKLEKLARAVCYIETTSIDLEKGHQEIRRGSGFYCKLTVKGSVLYGLITNNHVLKSQDACKDGNATFLYEGPGTGVKVQLRPEKLFRAHPKPLDYTFVGISHDDIVEKIPDLQPIEMETEPEPAEGDQIIIFQHPRGRPKEFSGDKILHVEKPFVRYRADTDKGSSGSPVVTTTGLKLIAVHHGGKAELGYNRGTLCSEILVHLRTGTCAPPAKRAKLSQDECNRLAPTVEMLRDLSQEITSFWKDLGIKLKVPYEKIKEIQDDNVPYPGVKDKAFQMLMVWKEQSSDVAKIMELSRALKDLGKNRTEMKYCSGSSFMDDTAI